MTAGLVLQQPNYSICSSPQNSESDQLAAHYHTLREKEVHVDVTTDRSHMLELEETIICFPSVLVLVGYRRVASHTNITHRSTHCSHTGCFTHGIFMIYVLSFSVSSEYPLVIVGQRLNRNVELCLLSRPSPFCRLSSRCHVVTYGIWMVLKTETDQRIGGEHVYNSLKTARVWRHQISFNQ